MSKLMLLLGAVAGLGVGVTYWPRTEATEPPPVALTGKPVPPPPAPPGPRQPGLTCTVLGTSFPLTPVGPYYFVGAGGTGQFLVFCNVVGPNTPTPAGLTWPFVYTVSIVVVDAATGTPVGVGVGQPSGTLYYRDGSGNLVPTTFTVN